MIIDLFSGCGGFSLGARQAGWDVGLSIDIDPDLTASYGLNFPKTKVLNEDIRNFDSKRTWKKVLSKEM
ncbi:DNA cytosine methyltransferase [Gynuella sunshinyii]|uniref:DNA (cytosine-5-)-methyltransferase n=1 Tax=Gynuella sunshinyii YC6258 TaxID=1445510 RepID=A0A0C5VCT8_9GAMM|nr:DNA cytosine methyltransferase [Gynuella sunshinyii]AJQ92292.1 site-specific DNA methylase [Gynuella sunshinyii YC6258]